MEPTHEEPLKIYFLPFMAMGHMIPLVHIARLVASRGEHVTVITTPSNTKFFAKFIEQDRATLGSQIDIHIINFPSKEVGLPEGLENSSFATNNEDITKMLIAANLLQQQVEAYVESNPPHVIVTDMVFTWSGQLTTSMGIPRLVFNALSIFVGCMTQAISQLFSSSSSSNNSDSMFIVPNLPHPITFAIKPSPTFVQYIQSLLDAEENSLGVIVNSFPEQEPGYGEHYEKLTGRKVWHVGPSLLMLNNHIKNVTHVNNDDNDTFGYEAMEYLNWLDKQENASVVYISFGSLCRFTNEQLIEIAHGIEGSRHKFLWVVHEGDDDDGWLPRGFEERMRKEERGMIIKGWAPQVKILKHPAIGVFFTHCGWNAMAEAIGGGVPMITMPGFGDQYYNEKLITQVCGFGVEVGAQEWRLSPYGGGKSVVGCERIEEAVKRLMDKGGDEDAVRVRKWVKELREKAWEAVQEGGSSHANVMAMIHEIKNVVFNKRNK